MNYKHTPGAWSANFMKLNGETYHWHVTDAKHGTVNAVAMADEEHGTPRAPEELRANAYLIAAAPDLLAALVSIVEMNPELPMGMIEAAQAAVEKATGERTA